MEDWQWWVCLYWDRPLDWMREFSLTPTGPNRQPKPKGYLLHNTYRGPPKHICILAILVIRDDIRYPCSVALGVRDLFENLIRISH